MSALRIQAGFTDSFETVIFVLRNDAHYYEAQGFLAKADCYRLAASELEQQYNARKAETPKGENDDA